MKHREVSGFEVVSSPIGMIGGGSTTRTIAQQKYLTIVEESKSDRVYIEEKRAKGKYQGRKSYSSFWTPSLTERSFSTFSTEEMNYELNSQVSEGSAVGTLQKEPLRWGHKNRRRGLWRFTPTREWKQSEDAAQRWTLKISSGIGYSDLSVSETAFLQGYSTKSDLCPALMASNSWAGPAVSENLLSSRIQILKQS